MARATIPGYPRIGRKRELKRALEGYWAGTLTEVDLLTVAADLRRSAWQTQRDAGLDILPVGDFSLYDQVLDAACLVGAVPARYGWDGDQVDLDTLFAMARGRPGGRDTRAMEMTKWFDTNYHYIVPELAPAATFRLASDKPFTELTEVQATGKPTKVVLVGPITFLLLSKVVDGGSPLTFLPGLLPVYTEVIARLAVAGADWIQLDEPALVTDLQPDALGAIKEAYTALADAKGGSRLLVQTAYGHVEGVFETLTRLPIDGIGLDFVRGLDQNLQLLERDGFPAEKSLVAGVVDGRNVWINDLDASLRLLDRIAAVVPPDRLLVSASCSLLHVPIDARREEELDPEVRPWLAFADQKLGEVVTLTRGLNGGRVAISDELDANQDVLASRSASDRRRDPNVQTRLEAISETDARRSPPFGERTAVQAEQLRLPPLPTTTIGSFPQTPAVRATRRRFERGEIDRLAYERFIENQIRETIEEQAELGLDLLVHGEFERNDMVQYFGEQLSGFAFTRHGWVQSFGSRYVRPPIIYGDVSRPAPMTVRWASYAQSLTDRPVKGMLTGPVTILNWSFVRDDQPRSATCRQIALAIRDEVADLQAAGIRVIQVDEPALREGLPLRRAEWATYLRWAVECFRLATAVARPETQIHTHMCYSEFEDIIDAIADLDADVLSIENARSGLEMLEVFRQHGYDKGVGPGVYDIHSPRVPPTAEIASTLKATLDVLHPSQLWVNPDCGLKTRAPDEVRAALANMVVAAREIRTALPGQPAGARTRSGGK